MRRSGCRSRETGGSTKPVLILDKAFKLFAVEQFDLATLSRGLDLFSDSHLRINIQSNIVLPIFANVGLTCPLALIGNASAHDILAKTFTRAEAFSKG